MEKPKCDYCQNEMTLVGVMKYKKKATKEYECNKCKKHTTK